MDPTGAQVLAAGSVEPGPDMGWPRVRCWQLGLLSLSLTGGGRASGAGSWVCLSLALTGGGRASGAGSWVY